MDARVALALVVGAACALTLFETRGQTFLSDKWGRLLNYNGAGADFWLRGYSGHFVTLHALLYKVLFEAFGATSYLPFRITHVVLLATCLVLFYMLASQRARPAVALIAVAVLGGLGSAWEITATPAGTILLLSMALGLGAIALLESGRHSHDVLACLLLVGAIASHSVGLSFVVVGAVMLFGRDGNRWGRLWVAWIPAAAYAAWYAWSRSGEAYTAGTDPVHASHVVDIPSGVAELAAATVASLTGLFRWPLDAGLSFSSLAGWILVLPACALLVWGARRPGLNRRAVWAWCAGLLSFWVLVSIVLSDQRPADSGRYLYPSAVFALLALTEISAAVRWRRGWLIALAAVAAVSITANVVAFQRAGDDLRARASLLLAASGALGLMGGQTPGLFDPNYALTNVDGSFDGAMGPNDTRYRTAMALYGNPGYAPEQILAAGPPARALADRMLMADRSIQAVAVSETPKGGGAGCSHLGTDRAITVGEGEKLLIFSEQPAPGEFLAIAARKFSPVFQGLPATGISRSYELETSPRDSSGLPWKVRVSAPSFVCPPSG